MYIFLLIQIYAVLYQNYLIRFWVNVFSMQHIKALSEYRHLPKGINSYLILLLTIHKLTKDLHHNNN